MDKARYLAELKKLLGFMSSWDRQAALKQYEQLFDDAPDAEALIEELGTPTRVAVLLARDYVPSPPPAAEADETPAETEAPAEAETSAAPETPETPVPAAEPEPAQRRVRPGGVAASILLILVIGIPVALLALCIGLPFLSGGVAVIVAAVSYVLHVIPSLTLVSDVLLMLGGGCAVSALGLLLACFGLWLSVVLAFLWLSRPVLGLSRRLIRGKEADKA